MIRTSEVSSPQALLRPDLCWYVQVPTMMNLMAKHPDLVSYYQYKPKFRVASLQPTGIPDAVPAE